MEGENEEIEIERDVWSKCFLCEEEYTREDIRMNLECLHSYCLECIKQSASTSHLCPICHSSLPSPLSSLPTNFTLQHWQTLSPLPLLQPLLNNINININNYQNEKEETKQKCEREYEEHNSHEQQSTERALPLSSHFIQYNECSLHNYEKMELYCMKCHECVCINCVDQFHSNHLITNVTRRVEDIKEKWKKSVEEVSKSCRSKLNVDFSSDIEQVNKEIKMLEEKLKSLNDKKERMIDRLKKESEDKEKINQTTLFLLSFLQTLPSLPLSSFIPSNNNYKINFSNITNENKEEKGRRRIRDFFEIENLFSLFSNLISSTKMKYSEEEKKMRNGMIFSNQLIQNENLISNFGSFGSKDSQFNYPNYITFNDKLNMIGVSDYNNKRIKIIDKEGSLIRSFPIETPRGIMIIPSLLLLAVSVQRKHVIEMFDISPLLSNAPRDSQISHNRIPLLYSIGEGYGGSEDHFHFHNPYGVGYSEEKRILALCDFSNKRIEIFKIRRDGYEHHSCIPSLPFYPEHISISSPGDIILVSDQSTVKMFKWEMGTRCRWREEGEVRPPLSLQPPLITPIGISIHSPFNYFAICDGEESRILFFNLTTRDLICSYQPTLPSTSLFFKYAFGLSIDEEADLICVSDISSHSISLFLSPLF